MPFGAHETMEVHEILMEKVNMLNQFNFYLQIAKEQRLIDIIIRHQQEEIKSYNELLSYTHDYTTFAPIAANTYIQGMTPQQIHYGVNNPPQIQPESSTNQLRDKEAAMGMLLCHKNAAKNGMSAALETADPTLRRILMNSAVNCADQAYEVFLYLNGQGIYQVPELDPNTAKSFLHSYVPTGKEIESMYFGQSSQGSADKQGSYMAGQNPAFNRPPYPNTYGTGAGTSSYQQQGGINPNQRPYGTQIR
ncbi:spore coat protein [Peribacillus kribbensis]|uniref:spore coat protein n=1 Tax=Peribacillus kribbensis TaxID=356658 RepID=UPI0004084B53|nr:spore coat protein [Peribacillus kribbensis]